MLNFLKTSSIIVLAIQSSVSFAATSDQDFQRCASEALLQRGQSAKVITVDNGKLKQHQIDHNLSAKISEYRMDIFSKATGANLGVVTCTLDNDGQVIASNFN